MCNLFKDKREIKKGVENDIYIKLKKDWSSKALEQKQEGEELVQKREKGYQNILNAIENVPNCFVETRRNIRKCVDSQLEILNHINDSKIESTYKIGFYDGINIMIEYLETRRNVK